MYFSLYFSILGVTIATPSCFCRSSGQPCLSELHIATRKGRPSGFLQSLVTRWAKGIAQWLVTLPALKLVILCNRWWYTYPSEKYWLLGMIIPNIWKVLESHKSHVPVITNQYGISDGDNWITGCDFLMVII